MSNTDYFDSSAFVKRYMAEMGSAWVQTRINDASRVIVTTDLARVEIAAALAGKLRGREIAREAYQQARERLTTDIQKRYQIVPVMSQRIDEAIELTACHRLRGYDAVHLACALHVNRLLLANELPPLILVAADDDLLKAACAAGLETIDPNLNE